MDPSEIYVRSGKYAVLHVVAQSETLTDKSNVFNVEVS